jgi:hypothetical protein
VLAKIPIHAEPMPLISRLYIWSVVLEPLLFFVLFERTVTGVTGNLSRMLQLMVLIGFFLRAMVGGLNTKTIGVQAISFFNPLFVNYGIYFGLAVVAGLLGLFSGAYYIPQAYAHNIQSSFSEFLNSKSFRPLFEYFIAVYYFFYFIYLPQCFLRTRKSVDYFLSAFRAMFIISLVIGMVDYAVAYQTGGPLVPRHLSDGVFVGSRFHGLAGEPRDAFVYLFLGLAILHLRAHFRGQDLKKWWIVVALAAALMTQSASGLIGIAFFVVLYSVFGLGKISALKVMRLIAVIALSIIFLFVAATTSSRIMVYVGYSSSLWDMLESGGAIPPGLLPQMGNIYPLYDLLLKLRDFDLLPVIVGSGLGSSSAVNNRYLPYEWAEMYNPNSQFVRTIYESGLIGFFLFIKSFVFPVKYFTRYLPTAERLKFLLLILLVVGCFFGHRNSAPFIYLGILGAVFRISYLEFSSRMSPD